MLFQRSPGRINIKLIGSCGKVKFSVPFHFGAVKRICQNAPSSTNQVLVSKIIPYSLTRTVHPISHFSICFASAIKLSTKSCISVSSGQFRLFRIPMISWTMGDVDPRLRFKDDFTSWVISVGKTEESAKRDARVKTSGTAAPTMVPTVTTSSEVDISVEEVKVLFKESNRRWRSAIFLWENRLSNWILFWNPFPKQNAQVVNLKNPDLDLIRRIHPECGFYGFIIRFGFAQKNAPTNSVFSSSSEASTYFQI